MGGIVTGIGGLLGLTGGGPAGSVPTPTIPQVGPNPFVPLDLTQILGADLGSIGLSPEQTALVDFLGGQQDTRTRDIYSRLGLGGSTMQAQDLGANELQRLAESQSLIKDNQQLALAERGQALQEQGLIEQGTLNFDQLLSQNQLQAQGQQITAQNNAANQTNQNFRNLGTGLSSLASAVGSFNS